MDGAQDVTALRPPQLRQLAAHALRRERVEPARWLVEKEHRRLRDELDAAAPAADLEEDDRRRTRESIRDGLLVVSALVGGFVTAKLGSGSDSMAYIFASFCWNMLTPEDVISESAMTASTVIVMATMSFVVMGIRMATGHVSQDVVYCWCAAAPRTCWRRAQPRACRPWPHRCAGWISRIRDERAAV